MIFLGNVREKQREQEQQRQKRYCGAALCERWVLLRKRNEIFE